MKTTTQNTPYYTQRIWEQQGGIYGLGHKEYIENSEDYASAEDVWYDLETVWMDTCQYENPRIATDEMRGWGFVVAIDRISGSTRRDIEDDPEILTEYYVIGREQVAI